MLENVKIKNLDIHGDIRGHLIECWRTDDNIINFMPEYPLMMYLSWTLPNQKRGPHLHKEQTDLFTFPGPGLFEIHLWDGKSADFKIVKAGSDQPKTILIPPGVVHGYINVSMIPGLVINCPDKLYKGWCKEESEDIIKFELEPNNPYRF